MNAFDGSARYVASSVPTARSVLALVLPTMIGTRGGYSEAGRPGKVSCSLRCMYGRCSSMLCSRSSTRRDMVSNVDEALRILLIISVSRGKGSSDTGVAYEVTSGKAIVARGW